ncbi:shikimate kinase [Geobacter grbiciae]|uniref:shikimate kinase n=1 Tax=Geobacter grbiciae TaxID=155042 RepID=UPI001C01F182|nr:shikimate kinase [Geobacter grbiciae]MBT1076588.1 shikimate kinase [Geobacter grbiciae]
MATSTISAPSNVRNVILTGFMGTGKSSVGRLLAHRLGFRYCDLDALIVEGEGVSINEIFARHGEPHFRALETEAVRSVSREERCVVSTGGGAVISPENRCLLREAGVVVNLTATVEEVCRRLREETDRPLLKDDRSGERIAAMMAEREQFYADAELRIDTTGKSVEDVVAEITGYLEGR